MAKYPNQRTVKVCKTNSTKYFASYGNPEIAEACKVLNGSGFKVWTYIFANANGFSLDISPASAEKYWGIAPSTFEDGINELITKGFIVDGVAYQSSTMNEYEIRKKKRNSNNREDNTDPALEYTENGWNYAENGWSNNKYKINNNKDNKEVFDASVSNFVKPKGDDDWLNSKEFIF